MVSSLAYYPSLYLGLKGQITDSTGEYSDAGNGVWAHSFDSASQTAEEIQHLDATTDSNPRHLTVHPNGNFVYAVYEEANSVAVYSRDNSTGLLTFTNTTYSLLPEGEYLSSS